MIRCIEPNQHQTPGVSGGSRLAKLVKIGAQGVARKPGAWVGLPKAEADWDAPATNRAIADALSGGKFP